MISLRKAGLGLIAGAALFCSAVSTAQATTISISDWGGVVAPSSVSNNSTVIVTNINTVSRFNVSVLNNGNPGSAFRVDSALSGGSAATTRYIPFLGATYDPSSDGEFISFDIDIDRRRVGSSDHGWGIILRQDGVLYHRNMYRLPNSNTTSYQTVSVTGQDASNLSRLTGTAADSIDFSNNGSVIDVGLLIYTGNGGASFRDDISEYDNFSITFNAEELVEVPAPASLVLLGAGLLPFGLRRKK